MFHIHCKWTTYTPTSFWIREPKIFLSSAGREQSGYIYAQPIAVRAGPKITDVPSSIASSRPLFCSRVPATNRLQAHPDGFPYFRGTHRRHNLARLTVIKSNSRRRKCSEIPFRQHTGVEGRRHFTQGRFRTETESSKE